MKQTLLIATLNKRSQIKTSIAPNIIICWFVVPNDLVSHEAIQHKHVYSIVLLLHDDPLVQCYYNEALLCKTQAQS